MPATQSAGESVDFEKWVCAFLKKMQKGCYASVGSPWLASMLPVEEHVKWADGVKDRSILTLWEVYTLARHCAEEDDSVKHELADLGLDVQNRRVWEHMSRQNRTRFCLLLFFLIANSQPSSNK